MNPRVVRILGLAAAVLVLVGTWFALVQPKRDQVVALEQETSSQQDASAQLRARISLLKKQSEEIPAKQAEMAAIAQRIPTAVGMSSLIRSLNAIALDAHVTVGSLSPEAPQPLVVPSGGAEGGSSTATKPTTPTKATKATKATKRQAEETSSLQVVDFQVAVCGSFAELRRYASGMEGMRRAVAVSAVKIERGPCGSSKATDDLTATLSASAFVTAPAEAAGTTSASDPATAATEGAS